MKLNNFILIIAIALSLSANAQSVSESADLDNLLLKTGIRPLVAADCDTLIKHNGYTVRIVKSNGKVSALGLALFSQPLMGSYASDLLSYMETALLAQTLGIEKNKYANVRLEDGNYSDFKAVNPQTECHLTESNGNRLSVLWKLKNGKELHVSVPIGYDTDQEGGRTAIENRFITAVKNGDKSRTLFEDFSEDDLLPYGEGIYMLPGGNYLNKDVTRNTYFNINHTPEPVWDATHPAESFANLVVFPSVKYGSPKMVVTVLKHEYGSKETFEVSTDQFIATAEKDGCLSFWGIENSTDDMLQGVIFLYNPKKRYDHVLKIECNPSEVIAGTGVIKARASLFIPTNNVRDLYAPYIKKKEDEKIRY